MKDQFYKKRSPKNGKGYKVHVFIHALKGYVVWIRNGQDIMKSIQVRGYNRDKVEAVFYERENVTQLTRALVPIDQIHSDISSELTEEQWNAGLDKFGNRKNPSKLRTKINDIANVARKERGIGMMQFGDFIKLMKKKGADSTHRSNR